LTDKYILPLEDLIYIKNSLKHEIDNLKKKTILITGATGLFGKWLLIFFLYLNYKYNFKLKIFLIIRITKKNLNFIKKIKKKFKTNIIILTIENYSLYKFTQKIDYFFHFATFSKNTNNWYEKHFDLSILELKKLLDFFSKKINYFIYSSSGAANFLITDNQQKDFYAECKRMSEQLLKFYSKKFKFELRIARCYSFVGKFLNKYYVIRNIIEAVKKNKPITLSTTGESIRSYLHMSDLIICFIKLIFLGKQDYIYNFGSDQKIKIIDCAKKIVLLSNKKVKIKINRKDNSKFDYAPCVKITKKHLKIKNFLCFDEIIKKMLK
jgi:nucleoside-diphosphate-sugar epimerase